MLQKILILLLISSGLLYARSIEVVPAKIDFKNNMEVDIVEEIYMMLHNGITNYNSLQSDTNKLINVKESFLPVRKYKKKINSYYSKNKSAYKQQYMIDNELDFVVEYRIRKDDVKVLPTCKKKCKVDIQVFLFKKNAPFIKEKITLNFDKSVYSLTDNSYEKIDQFMASKLD